MSKGGIGSWLSSWFISDGNSYYTRRWRAVNSISPLETVNQQWTITVKPWFADPWEEKDGVIDWVAREQILNYLQQTLDLSEDGKAEQSIPGKSYHRYSSLGIEP